jgi:hypothetical protein
MSKQHDTDHTAPGRAKAMQLLAELAQATLAPHPGGEQGVDAITRELKALVTSGAVAGAHLAAMARSFSPIVASGLQELASDPNPVVRANSLVILDCAEARAMVEQVNRTKSERAC